MTQHEVFEAWAPVDGCGPGEWTRWVKPILFQHAMVAPPPGGGVDLLPPVSARWSPPRDGAWAILADLPGRRAVDTGLALAREGWRPVPVLNGAPPPADVVAAVDTGQLVKALEEGAAELADLRLRPGAPPAFLLDADRQAGWASPGQFDNRWIVLPQDLPSAGWLSAHGVRAVRVALSGTTTPSADLAHVLLRWQRAGLRLDVVDADRDGDPEPLTVRPPSGFGSLTYAALALLGLRPNATGAFGRLVPRPPEVGDGGGGGGFYGGFG